MKLKKNKQKKNSSQHDLWKYIPNKPNNKKSGPIYTIMAR